MTDLTGKVAVVTGVAIAGAWRATLGRAPQSVGIPNPEAPAQ